MSHDTRFSGGLAYGKYANLFSRSDNLIGFGDTTPDVTDGNYFIEANTSATTITHFDLSDPSGGATVSQHFQGKVIRILFTTDNTTVTNGGRLILTEGAGVINSGTTLDLVYHNSSWYETNRSRASQSNVLSVTLGGGSGGLNVNNVSTILFGGNSVTNTLQSFSGGYIGQVVNIASVTSNNIQILGTIGNIRVTNTSNFILSNSGAYFILKTASNEWTFSSPTA